MFFNLCMEKIFHIALANKKLGIKVNCVRISNVHYADDAVLLAKFLDEIQEILQCQRMGVEVQPRNKCKKDQIMIVSREKHENAGLPINSEMGEFSE